MFREGANTFSSPWCEVAYFLVRPEPQSSQAILVGLARPFLALYRSQFAVVPDNTAIMADAVPDLVSGYIGYESIGCIDWGSIDVTKAGSLYFMTPSDLTNPALRTLENAARRSMAWGPTWC